MPGLVLSASTLESYLRQDHVFVDYFNEYLVLPIFCLKLHWDTHTALIKRQENNTNSKNNNHRQSVPCLLSTSESSGGQLMQWTIEHRLVCFQNSELYHQYKLFRQLAKLEILPTEKTFPKFKENNCPEVYDNEGAVRPTQLLLHHSSVARSFFPPILKDKSTVFQRQSYPNSIQNIREEREYLENKGFFQAEKDINNGRESVLEFKTNFAEEDSLKTEFESISPGSTLASIEILKDDFICEAGDMKAFINFLMKVHAAKKLYLFWMEIEVFKTQKFYLKEERMRIFRLIQEQFYSQLTSSAQALIRESVNDQKTALNLLTQAQLDVLERLHDYWLPRYILHCTVQQSKQGKDYLSSRNSHVSCETIFPSLSFVKSLPIMGEKVKEEVRSKPFQELIHSHDDDKNGKFSIHKTSAIRETRTDLLMLLNKDRQYGSPFTNWIDANCSEVSVFLSFLLDLKDLKSDVEVMNDRLLRVCAVWRFFHKHLGDSCRIASKEEIKFIHSTIKNLENISCRVLEELFASTQSNALNVLRPYWVEYYKHDNCTEGSESETRQELQEEKENISPSQRCFQRTENKDGESKRWVGGRAQQGDNFWNISKEDKSKEDNSDYEEDDDEESEEDDEDFLDNVNDTEIMSNFKSFVQNEEGRGMMNDLLMYLEIETYFSLGPGRSLQKNQNALAIFKTFFEKSRRSAHLPDILIKSVPDERPTSIVLREAQQYVLPQLTTCFVSFTKCGQGNANSQKQRDERKKKSTGQNKKEPQDAFGAVKEVKLLSKTTRKGSGCVKAPVTRDDRQLFNNMIGSSTDKHRKNLAENFRRYLLKCEDSGFPRLEKNLLFYLEVVKFKEFFPYFEEISLNRKAEVIVDVFLDSASPPWLQVDISPEIASRISQKVQQLYNMKKPVSRDFKDSMIFDEAQQIVLKELLPFWSGFLKNVEDEHKMQTPKETKPMDTKIERRQRRLYKEFLNFQEKLDPVEVAPSGVNSDNDNNSVPHSRLLFSLRGYQWKDSSTNKKWNGIT